MKKTIHLVSGWLIVIFLVSHLFVMFMNRVFNLYLITSNINQERIQSIIIILAYISAFIWTFTFFKNNLVKTVISILGVIGFGLIIFIQMFSSDSAKNFEFVSPDGENMIIIEEQSWLLGCWSDIYLKKNFILGKNIAHIITDDGYRPFSAKDYSIEWKNNTEVKITYNSDSGESSYHYVDLNLQNGESQTGLI